MKPRDGTTWLTSQQWHEGYPLVIRRPKGVDYHALPPKLVIVTLVLDPERTLTNGLPNPDYNDSLVDFDDDVLQKLSGLNLGRVVLIQTLCHERTYYAYCDAEQSLAGVQAYFLHTYPNLRVELREQPDPKGDFIRNYAAARL
jgi:hypothetical protein